MKLKRFLYRVFSLQRVFAGPAIVSAVSVGVFLHTYRKYRYGPQYYYLYAMLGESLCWSRGSASVLSISSGLVLLAMCRNVLTFIRNSCKFYGRIFRRSLDRSIWFHKACALVIVIASGIHIGAHIVNAVRFSSNFSFDFTDLNLAAYPNQEPFEIIASSVPGVTGILMMIILLAMIVTSTHAVRRASYEIFWYTHHAFILFFSLLFVHGLGGVIKHQVNLDAHPPGCKMTKNSTEYDINTTVHSCTEGPVFENDRPEVWMWCIGPVVLYIAERLVRMLRGFQKVELISVVRHTDSIIELKMKKKNFTAKPGQYIFIKCVNVSRFEWHPFTLTQCPSAENQIFSIHFQIFGDWTEKFAEVLVSTKGEENKRELVYRLHNGLHSSQLVPKIRLAIDGPYGSPCMDVWQYDVSLCIATGIGVTPFAAVINQLRHKLTTSTTKTFKLRRIYFIWVCKHVQSFQWFVDLLHSTHRELWESNRPDFLICNFYVTGLRFEDEIIMKQLDGWFAVRLHNNRPIWKSVFDRVSRENLRTEVGVFYCGSGKLTETLKRNCQRFYPTRTKFILNKEVLY